MDFQPRYRRGRLQKTRNDTHKGYFYSTTSYFDYGYDRDIQDHIIFSLKCENIFSNDPNDWIADENPFSVNIN